MTNRLRKIFKSKILIVNLVVLLFFASFSSYAYQWINTSATAVITIPAKLGFTVSKVQTEDSFGIENIEKQLDNYIPGFIKDFFNSYPRMQYTYRTILLFFLIIILFVLNFIFVLFIFVNSNKRQNQFNKYLDVYRTMYEGAILSYILGESNWEETQQKLKKSDLPQNRELLSSVLMNFNENLKGVAEQMIPEVFVKMGLHNDALQQANSKVYNVKVAGIRKLTLLYPEGAMKIIPGLLNDDHDIVRSEAQTAYVRLNPDDPFQFLKTLKKPFARWTQINAFHIFRAYRKTLPSFADYLESKNQNVQNFSLRMITFYQQLENVPEILKMIDSEHEMTRFLAIKAVNDLRLYDGKSLLKARFENETQKNKAEIIKAFKNIGETDDFEFLEKIISGENVSLKLEACRSLFFMSAGGKEKLMEINNKMNGGLEVFIAHISDSRNG